MGVECPIAADARVERCISSVRCLRTQLYVTINMISRPIFIPFQLYTQMFAEGGDAMNNSSVLNLIYTRA